MNGDSTRLGLVEGSQLLGGAWIGMFDPIIPISEIGCVETIGQVSLYAKLKFFLLCGRTTC